MVRYSNIDINILPDKVEDFNIEVIEIIFL